MIYNLRVKKSTLQIFGNVVARIFAKKGEGNIVVHIIVRENMILTTPTMLSY